MGSLVSVVQTGQDGLGLPKTLSESPSVRLKAKSVTTTRNSTLKITGNQTAAVWTIQVIVEPGSEVFQYYPPPLEIVEPTANFTLAISSV